MGNTVILGIGKDTDLSTWTRESLIEWLKKYDRNGVYSDEQSISEGMLPLTKESAIFIINQFRQDF